MGVVYEHPLCVAAAVSVLSIAVAVAALEWGSLRARRDQVRLPEYLKDWVAR